MALRNFISEDLRGSLRGYPAGAFSTNQPILIRGVSVIGDTLPEVWAYDAASTATDDGVTVLKPNSLTITDPGRYLRQFVINAPLTRTFNNAPGRALVSVNNVANGFQISSSKDTSVNYSVSISTSVSLSGNSSGYAVLEICSTNSVTPGDWAEIARTASGQSGSLVVGLVLNQTGGGNLSGMVPAGYYARIRTVNVSGTPTYAMNGQQEVTL